MEPTTNARTWLMDIFLCCQLFIKSTCSMRVYYSTVACVCRYNKDVYMYSTLFCLVQWFLAFYDLYILLFHWLFPIPITWGRQNSFGLHSSTLSCPLRPRPLTSHFPYFFYKSLSTWFSVFISIFSGINASDILLTTCPSPPFICPYHFIIFPVIFYANHATVTDLLTCSFLILSILCDTTHPSQHPHLIYPQPHFMAFRC